MTDNGLTNDSRVPERRAVLFVNLRKKSAQSLSEEIRLNLEARGIPVSVLSFEGVPRVPERGDWDIVFSLGGDGTVLYTARMVSPWGLPIFPVNLGTLGFIADVQRDVWPKVFDQWLDGKAKFSRRCMLELFVLRRGEKVARFNCLNDVVIAASGIAKLISLNVLSRLSDGGYVELGPYRCDGLLIATATGSTAYSMAAGGPILDAEMEAMILNPICPFTLSNRPLVLSSQQTLEITVVKEQRSGVLLTVDGQDIFNLEPGDKIVIQEAPYKAVLISSGHDAYYTALRTKLNWPAPASPSGVPYDAGGDFFQAGYGGGRDA